MGWHHLEYDGERARVFDGMRIGEQLFRALTAPLDDMPAETVLALRREADVGHDRDARRDDPPYLLGAAHAALEFHGVGMRFLHETERGVQRLIRSRFI